MRRAKNRLRRNCGAPCHSHPVATAVAKARMASHMTTVSIAVYMAADGEPARDLLSHLGWVIGIGAEIAAAVRYLVGAEFVTGAVVPVDGGFSAGR